MKKGKVIILGIAVAMVLYIFNILWSTGFFRSIESSFDSEIVDRFSIKGAEDITIDYLDSLIFISSTDRKIYPPDQQEDGALYMIDGADPILITGDLKIPFAPHGISIYRSDSIIHLAAINHTLDGHSIEFFKYANDTLIHDRSMRDPSMIQPNDLVLVNESQSYFTNDHRYTEGIGKLAEEYLGLKLSNVIYYDGKEYNEVADGIAYANGINYDSVRKLLFVASPRHFLVKVYDVSADGHLLHVEDMDCGTGVDNIELDPSGVLWIGCHPNLIHFGEYAKGKEKISPSEIIKIDYREKGDYSIEQMYLDDGSSMSGSTVAAPIGDKVYIGNVMDDHIVILKN